MPHIVLMATIQGAIHESFQSEKDKLACKTERLELDRLELDRRAANDAAMHQFLHDGRCDENVY